MDICNLPFSTNKFWLYHKCLFYNIFTIKKCIKLHIRDMWRLNLKNISNHKWTMCCVTHVCSVTIAQPWKRVNPDCTRIYKTLKQPKHFSKRWEVIQIMVCSIHLTNFLNQVFCRGACLLCWLSHNDVTCRFWRSTMIVTRPWIWCSLMMLWTIWPVCTECWGSHKVTPCWWVLEEVASRVYVSWHPSQQNVRYDSFMKCFSQ